MSKSTTTAAIGKPRPDFPLFPHATGRWAKKVQGSLLYFGHTADDTDGANAHAVWLAEKDYCLLHGKRPSRTPSAPKCEGPAASELSKKLKKPRPDFPLFPHATGRWAKKIKGNLLYFG